MNTINITGAAGGLLILGFLFHLFKMWRDKRREGKQIKNLKIVFKESSFDDLYQNHLHITNVINEKYTNEVLAKHWKEFDESLVFNDGKIENTLDASHFFNVRTLCPRTFENEVYKWVPSALIGVGVLFTFIGLITGLYGLDVSSDDIDNLRLGVQSILDGAIIAFASSILGIILSLIFAGFEKKFKTSLRISVSELQNIIDFKYPRTNPEKSLVLMSNYTKQTEEHLGALSEKLGDKLQEVVRGISDELKEGIQSSLENSIGPYMEQIASKAMNSSETAFNTLVDEFLEKVGNAGKEQRELILKVNEEIQRSLIEFREKFTDQVTGLKESIERLNESYHFIEEYLIKDFRKAIGELSETIEGQKQLKDLTTVQIGEQISIVKETRESLVEYLKDIQKVSNNIQELTESFTIAADNLDITNSNSQEVNKLIAEAAKSLQEPFNELRNEYSLMRDEVEGKLNMMSKHLKDMMDEYFEKVSKQTIERMGVWNDQTYEFSKNMVTVTRQFNNVVVELNKLVSEDSK